MPTEHLHHTGEDARLNHTQSDIRFRHALEGAEAMLVICIVAILALAITLMIVL